MKLDKRLTVNGEEVPLVSEKIRLDLDRPGRAVFQVLSPAPLSGTVAFSLGWNPQEELTLHFTGEVEPEGSIRVDAKQQRLFCRELAGRLDAPHPVALRHPTLKEVLAVYAKRTGLSFILPPKPYASRRVPAFYGLGSGFQGLASVGVVFGIDDYVWFPQGDGRVFVGSWEDSRWKGRHFAVPEDLFSRATAGRRACPAVPGLRPGAVLNGKRVRGVHFSGHEMEVVC